MFKTHFWVATHSLGVSGLIRILPYDDQDDAKHTVLWMFHVEIHEKRMELQA